MVAIKNILQKRNNNVFIKIYKILRDLVLKNAQQLLLPTCALFKVEHGFYVVIVKVFFYIKLSNIIKYDFK